MELIQKRYVPVLFFFFFLTGIFFLSLPVLSPDGTDGTRVPAHAKHGAHGTRGVRRPSRGLDDTLRFEAERWRFLVFRLRRQVTLLIFLIRFELLFPTPLLPPQRLPLPHHEPILRHRKHHLLPRLARRPGTQLKRRVHGTWSVEVLFVLGVVEDGAGAPPVHVVFFALALFGLAEEVATLGFGVAGHVEFFGFVDEGGWVGVNG